MQRFTGMREPTGTLDGFPLIGAIVAIAGGAILWATGFPAGWSGLLVADGCVILAVQWAVARDVEIEISDRVPIVLAAVGVAAVALAFVYLTRAADDLPSLFPGHDGDSEHFRVLPGVIMLGLGAVTLGLAAARVRVTHHTHET